MKNVGSFFEYEEQRNADLLRAYRQQLALKENTSLSAVFERVVNMPSKRFWVSEERAAIVMHSLMRGETLEKMRPTKREMYLEIYRRVLKEMADRPGDSLYDIVFDVVNSPAPKFYLTPGSAKVIIYKIRCQWYEGRKKKYRHLFM